MFDRLRKPDLKWYLKKQLRCFVEDIQNRLQKKDIRTLAIDWEIKGIDISYWNQDIDFAVLATKVDFVLIRAGYGNDYIDPRLEEYRQGCIDHNIPYGLYWYVKPDKAWDKHAYNFYVIWSNGKGVIYPTFDLEEAGGKNKTDLESWWQKMYNRFNSLAGIGYPDEMTYTSPGFLNTAIGLTNWMKLTNLDVAHWTGADAPILPNEWAVPGKSWKFWQWSSVGSGADYGIASRYVDLQRYNGTRAQFEAEFGVVTTPPPDPDPEPPPGNTIVPIGDFTVSSEYRNLRAAPTTDAAAIGKAMRGSKLPYVEEDGEWKKVIAWTWKAGNE